jgi:enhancing lycopene biosynthesis protein 2
MKQPLKQLKRWEVHEKTSHGQIVVDEKYKVVTTPCYMLDATIDQIADGAENVVQKILEMA